MTSEFPIAVLAAMEYSRTCEMGLSQHTGIPYHSILYLVVWRWYSPDSCPQKGVVIRLQTG